MDKPVVHRDPEILGGTPVFVGTRVPVKNLFDYLEAGDSLDEFLTSFPSVTREQAVAALELARGVSPRMRILLDESLPIELAAELSGHDVISVQKMRWSGLKNGELLTRAAGQFEVLLTADQNLPYQQNLDRLPIAVVVIAQEQSNRGIASAGDRTASCALVDSAAHAYPCWDLTEQ